MPSLINLRRRIKSAKNISQITKAMEMVSASKMRKSQEQSRATKPFSSKLQEIISHINSSVGEVNHPLIKQVANPKRAMLVIVSTDKGLCGPLNANLYREILDWGQHVSSHSHLSVVHVRKRAKTPTFPHKETELLAVFHELAETPTFEEARSIARLAIDSFINQQVDEVYVAYPEFVSTLVNKPLVKKILPVDNQSESTGTPSEYTFEPSTSELVQELVPYMVETSIYQILIDASASEHSSRMIAMKNASDNAKDLIHNLTLDYNQARQSQVTSELLDATTARMALA